MTRSLRSLSRFRLRPLSLLLLLLGTSLSAQAQTIRYMRTNGPNTNPATATSSATNTTTLQGTIEANSDGDQVWVAQGTYKPGGNANTNRDTSFAMKNGVSILGALPPRVIHADRAQSRPLYHRVQWRHWGQPSYG